MKLALIAVLLCGAVICTAPVDAYDFPGTGSATAWSEALPYYNKGNQYMNEQRFDQAAEMYRQAVARYPHDADFFMNLGVAYRKLDDYASAEQAYKSALAINDKDWATWSNLGNAYLKQNKLKETLSAFERALKCNPPAEDKANLNTDIADLHKVMKNLGLEPMTEPPKSNASAGAKKATKPAAKPAATPVKKPAPAKDWGYQ